MTDATKSPKKRKPAWRIWVHRAFLVWAVLSTSLLLNSFRTRGVDHKVLQDSRDVSVRDGAETLHYRPKATAGEVGLIFICGSGVAARAYAPLLQPIAESGYNVFIIKLPFRLAPLESHKVEAIERVETVMREHDAVDRWVVSGHSLGGALAARLAAREPQGLAALVLVGTTHPKEANLSSLSIPVAKVYGAVDGVAPREKIMANKRLLPEETRWVEIEGGNHSQFGHYGHQLMDGTATISREEQQRQTRQALLDVLRAVSTE